MGEEEKELPAQTKEERKAAAQKLKEEKKALKAQAKELKKQQRAIEEAGEDEEGGAISVILVTVVIVLIWVAILALLIKLDVGGFGSNVLAPILKDVPVINKILPETAITPASDEEGLAAGYDNLEQALARIKELENELDHERQQMNTADDTIDELTAEVARLKTYEDNQIAFEKIKDEFDNEVVFNSKAPAISEYRKYYEQIDPTNAEILYKEVIKKEQEDAAVKDYAKAYSSMKPAAAAVIFASDPLKSDLELSAKILGTMSADARGAILAQIGSLDDELAGNITRVMEPEEGE